MRYKQLIFDLDGTLSNPQEGIKNSIQYALDCMGIEKDIDSIFLRFIGPPLHDAFQHTLDLNPEQTEQAVSFFREYYGTKGFAENTIYPGIELLLGILKEKDCEIHLATSKLEKYAIKVLEHHDILQYFSIISGASYKGKGADKTFLIKQVIGKKSGIESDEFLMIGDKHFDILGAKSAGIKSLGVLYGYGTEKELINAHADFLVKSVDELTNFLLQS